MVHLFIVLSSVLDLINSFNCGDNNEMKEASASTGLKLEGERPEGVCVGGGGGGWLGFCYVMTYLIRGHKSGPIFHSFWQLAAH